MATLPPAIDPRSVHIPGRIHTLTGDVRLHPRFHSRFLANDRDVIVWLPPGYRSEAARRYPILYLQDGQNVFDGATSFLAGIEWRFDETAQRLVQAGQIEPLIIVGVSNTGLRGWEYLPPPFSIPHAEQGADLYGRLLLDELMPAIEAEYRVQTGPENTGLGGSSLGGAVSLYLGLRYPQVFGRLAVLSPGIRRSAQRVLAEIRGLRSKPATRLWLDAGTREGGFFLGGARLIRDALLAKGWQPGDDLVYREVPGGLHNEAAWAQRVAPLLRFLFPPIA
ncbi:MAG TPA: alpha/beta hydrolase-fold protein [Dehalococcoidia bacterium]|nr:alpha/beta hydrolase-fold protein [Dehalococcoidia bacterium]